VGIDISSLGNLTAFMARVAARPAVQEALRAEGLAK
jgi:glutathione S-transferase